MVRLDKIVTKAGDGGKTRLATGEPVSKAHARVKAYGAVDEANSAIGSGSSRSAASVGSLIPGPRGSAPLALRVMRVRG